MNLNSLLKKGIIVFALALFITPGISAAVELKETIPIHIQLNIDWNKPPQGGNTRETGSLTLNVSGNAQLTGKKGELLQYQPAGMQAFGTCDVKTIMEDPNDKCYGKVMSTISGSGTVPITPPSSGKSSFLMQVSLGHLGKVTALQQMGRAQEMVEAIFEEEDKESSYDNYVVFLTGSLNVTYKGGLCDGPATAQKGVYPFAVRIFKELTAAGMYGSDTWKSETCGPHIDIRDFHGYKVLGPEQGGADATYKISWTFGEVQPILQIWYTDQDGQETNITDEKDLDVLVGQKIRLEAVVKPNWVSLGDCSWDIPANEILADFVVSPDHEKGKPKSVEKFNRPTIEFAWKDGAFSGIAKEIKCSGTAEGKEVQARATFNVYEPRVDTEVYPGKVMNAIVKKGSCELLLYENGQGHGMTIKSTIQMPDIFAEHPFTTQFVQLVKEDCWWQKGCVERGYDLHHKEEPYLLDEDYPYVEGTTPIELNDSPGGEVQSSVHQLFIKNHMLSHLMFIPCGTREDPDCVWVNLQKVEWGWKGVLRRTIDFYPQLKFNQKACLSEWDSADCLSCSDFEVTKGEVFKIKKDSSDTLPSWEGKSKGPRSIEPAGETENPNWKPGNW
jgi:hypothetical protein